MDGLPLGTLLEHVGIIAQSSFGVEFLLVRGWWILIDLLDASSSNLIGLLE